MYRVKRLALASCVVLLMASCGPVNRPLLVIEHFGDQAVEFYIADAEGASVDLLASVPRSGARWLSPNLQYVAWAGRHDLYHGSLHLTDIKTGRETVVTESLVVLDTMYFFREISGGINVFNVSWSPDSSALLFLGEGERSWDVFVYDLEQAQAINLTHDQTFQHTPVWSPDGQHIAFATYLDSDQLASGISGGIEIVTRDGQSRTSDVANFYTAPWPFLEDPRTMPECSLRWSPNSEYIAYVIGLGCIIGEGGLIGAGAGLTEVFITQIESGETKQLTHLSESALEELGGNYQVKAEYAIAWSPDGEQLLVGFSITPSDWLSTHGVVYAPANSGLRLISVDSLDSYSLATDDYDAWRTFLMWNGKDVALRVDTYSADYSKYIFAKTSDGQITLEDRFPGFTGGCGVALSPDLAFLAYYEATIGESGSAYCKRGGDIMVVSSDGNRTVITSSLGGENRVVGWYSSK